MSKSTLFAELVDDTSTDEAFADPQVGDRFTEMLSFWVYVIARDDESFGVAWIELHPPCDAPKDGKSYVGSVDAFRQRFAYGSRPGYWVHLHDRGNDVAGWFRGVEACERKVQP